MSIPQVQTIVKKKMIRVSMSEDNGITTQTIQVQKRIVRGGIARQQRYNLFFKNGQLTGYDKDSGKFSF